MHRITRLLAVIAILVIPMTMQGQNRLKSISLGSGEDPISSGISMVARFQSTDSARYAEFAIQNEQAWLAYGKQLNGSVKGHISASAGYFQGQPWVGPYASLSYAPFKIGGKDFSLNTFHWPVLFFAKEPRDWQGKKNPESMSVGYLGSFGVSWGYFSLNYATLDFLHDKINSLPSASIEIPLAEIPLVGKLTTSATYTWNTNAGRPLYFMGLTFAP